MTTAPGDGLALRILVSYHYFKNDNLDKLMDRVFPGVKPEVFADSGAWSAYTLGAKIDLDDYAAWIKRWRHHFTVYANLDDLRDPDATKRNQHALEDRYGLEPLPVFHAGESLDVLEYYLARYRYVGIGAMIGKRDLMPFLVRCFKMAAGRSVYHGFGMTSWEPIKALPWYSVDSSTWCVGFRFGVMPLFDPTRGRIIRLPLGDARAVHRHGALLRATGVDPNVISDRSRYSRTVVAAFSALAYMQAERWLRQRHGPVRMPDDSRPPGLNVHIANAAGHLFEEAREGLQGFKLHLADTVSVHFRDVHEVLGDRLAEDAAGG